MKTERGDLNSVTRHDPEPIPPPYLISWRRIFIDFPFSLEIQM